MTHIVTEPFPPEEVAYFDYAASRYDNALDIRDAVASFSLMCSLLAIYVMIRMQVYKYSLMGVIFFMTLLQACYDTSIFTTYCGDPYVSLSNKQGVQSQEWIECKSVQMAFVRATGIAVGLCTNIISAAVVYVIYYEKRLPLTFYKLTILVSVPSVIIGVFFGIYFYEQTVQYGLKGYLGGQSNFNILNFIYIAYLTMEFVINLCCVIYISLYFYRSGMLQCGKKTSLRAFAENSERSVNGVAVSGLKERSYPMFALSKRLIFYPVTQSLVIFGGSFYAYGQGGAAVESYIWNVTSNPDRVKQTIQLYCFSALMPLAGFCYFLTFMTFQKGAWKVLIDTFKIEIPAFFGCGPCDFCFGLCLFCRRGEAMKKAEQANMPANKTGLANGMDEHAPNPRVHIHDGRSTENPHLAPGPGVTTESQRATDSHAPHSPHAPVHLRWVNSAESRNPHRFLDHNHNRHDDVRMSYTFDERERESCHRESTLNNSVASNSGPERLQDINLREDSIAYYQERMSTFRAIAAINRESVASHLSTIEDLCAEDIDGMQEDDLIELIEISKEKAVARERAASSGTMDKENPLHKTEEA